MTNSYNVLVIGGGPGGAAAALLLARSGWSVAVVERKRFPRRKVCGEYLSATNGPLLHELGIGEVYRESAGPEVRRVGLFAGPSLLEADLPRWHGAGPGWGRALARERLDTLLLAQARAAGASVWQPWSVAALAEDPAGYKCRLVSQDDAAVAELHARIVIAAHGSWDPGPLPTQQARRSAGAGDLLAFKAHFRDSGLPADLMPLLAFPGGYGGMVHCDGGRVSLSCCVRRDRLQALRGRWPGDAGPAVLQHITQSCAGVRTALDGAVLEGPWLAAGPLRPGIRLRERGGIFQVGNAAGEAHPVIAEGISMALQSAWLLTEGLGAWRTGKLPLAAVGQAYRRAWRANFAPRLRAAAIVAHWAMRPGAVAGLLPLLRRFPALLTWGARLAGKDRRLLLQPS